MNKYSSDHHKSKSMRILSKLVYALFGWKAEGGVPEGITQAVFIIAPHTSNWDFYIGRLYCWIHGIPINLLIKKKLLNGHLEACLKNLVVFPLTEAGQPAKLFK